VSNAESSPSGPPSEAPAAASWPPQPAARRTRIAVVVNGNAKSVTQEVIATLDQILMGGDLFVSRRLRDAREIARTLVSRGYGTVLTGGGDGTFTVMVTEVVREARRQNRPLPRFGLLQLGTGNALAWVVGASKAKGRGLAADIQRLLVDAGSRTIRLIEVEDYIAPFCGFGADALVLGDYAHVKNQLLKTPLRRIAPGPLSYAIATVTRSLPSYFFRKMSHCRVTNDGADAYRLGAMGKIMGLPIPTGEVIYEGPMRIAAVSTIPYYGFGFRVFPYAEERDDRMHLRISTIGPVPFVANFKAIWRGSYENPEVLFDYLVENITIQMDPPAPFQIGGDPRGERSRVHARLSSQPIQLVDFYAPPSAD
jgi:diacylglycerol kinase family enzyme